MSCCCGLDWSSESIGGLKGECGNGDAGWFGGVVSARVLSQAVTSGFINEPLYWKVYEILNNRPGWLSR